MSRRALLQGIERRAATLTKANWDQFGAFAAGGYIGQTQAPFQQWLTGTGMSGALPRPIDDFLTGAFGPLNPIIPTAIDSPDESGRPIPRRWQYPIGWNMPIGTPGSEGLKLTSFANLRAYADMYSVVRACIQTRKEEILGLEWDISPTDSAEKSMRMDYDRSADFQERRAEVMQFFRRPDHNYHDFQTWLGALLEDIFVVDALAIYLHPTRLPGRGLLGSDLAALEILDGTTIRPLLDIRGGKPRPPAPSYQQYLWGVPRVDLLDIILESDIEYIDEPVATYRSDQLLYLPYTKRTWTPYGFPGIERALIPVATGLKKQEWALDFFTEGSIPGLFIIPGSDVSTPQQWRQLQDALNALAGDTAYKHRIIVLPPESKTEPQKSPALADQFDEILMTQVLMAYDVQPMELGISPKVSTTTSPGAARQMAKATQDLSQRKALKPMLMWMKRALFDFILQDICGQTDMQWVWRGMDDQDDLESQADQLTKLIGIGLKSIDEARADLGLNPWGLPLTSDPIFVSPTTGPIPFGTIMPAQEDAGLSMAPIATSDEQASAPQQSLMPPAPTAGSNEASPTPVVATHNSPTPPQFNVTPTPLHAKAMVDELRRMRRWLRKGHDVTEWQPVDIPLNVWPTLAKRMETHPNDDILSYARTLVKAQNRLQERRMLTQRSQSRAKATLTSLGMQVMNGKLDKPAFVAKAKDMLAGMYQEAANAAIAGANETVSGCDSTKSIATQVVNARLAKQAGFLNNLADDISGLDERSALTALSARLGSYGSSTTGVYEEVYGKVLACGAGKVPSDLIVTWHADLEGDPCDQCWSYDGNKYALADLPQYPGDVHPDCECYIDWDAAPADFEKPVKKNITLSTPLASGMVPFDLEGQSTPPPKRPRTDIEVAYRGLSCDFAQKCRPGMLLTDTKMTVAALSRAPLGNEPFIAKIHVKMPVEERNGYVRFPAMTVYRVLSVTMTPNGGEVELEAS